MTPVPNRDIVRAPLTTTVARGARLVVAAVVTLVGAGVLAVSTTPASASASPRPGFACASAATFTRQHPGKLGSVSVTFHGVSATFVATSPPTSTITALPDALPFGGSLTLHRGSTVWSLPRPTRPKDAALDQLCIVQFNATTHPAVLIEGYTGGAHCCYEPVLYDYDRATANYRTVIDWSPQNYRSSLRFDDNGGYRPVTIAGHVLLRTEDDAFAYTFGCFACTPMPIRLDALQDGRLVDVTAHYPSAVANEATGLWRATSSQLAVERRARAAQRVGPFGLLAAWVADECVLGRGASAWTTLRHVNAEGLLTNAIYYRDTLIKPRGSFRESLRRFLLAHRYCTGQVT